jgi:hypothetical protein
MKVTMLIGEPAVGKSTIMKKFMSRVGNWNFHQPKYVPHHINLKNGQLTAVLGSYDDKTHAFPGTDRMSMAAQPEVIKFLQKRLDQQASIFFEGDRLGNLSMIEALQKMEGVDLCVVQIITSNWVVKQRERPSQTDRFRASRKTKIANMQHAVQVRFVNDSPSDLDTIVEWLIRVRG